MISNNSNFKKLIPIRDITLLKPTKIKEVSNLVDKYMPTWDYKIPELTNSKVKYLIGLSGGVDSAALTAALLAKHPELYGRVTLLFSDTGNEPDGCYEILDLIEEYFGIHVIRLDDISLFGSLDDNGGYLPSPRSRWCTGKLKIEPWNKYIKEHLLTDDEVHVVGFSGVRWDERDRMGVTGLDHVTSYFPFVDQKIERPAVCSFASDLNLMSSAYMQGVSRSGCKVCLFKSKQELISLKIWDRKSFAEGQSKEKVATHILERLSQDKNMNLKPSGFYTPYPFSSLVIAGKESFTGATLFGDERFDEEGKVTWDYRETCKKVKRNKKSVSASQDQLLFELNDKYTSNLNNGVIICDSINDDESIITEEECILYVGVENYKHSSLSSFSNDDLNGVWQQRLITYSRTLGGLSRALSGYHYHRQMASRSYFHDENDYNNQSHITVIAFKFPKGVIPKIEYKNDSYTWSSGRSYAELDYIVRCIDRASELLVSKQVVLKKKQHIITEQAEKFIKTWESDGSPDLGIVTGIGHFRPKPITDSQFDSYEENILTVRCPICSI